MFANRERRILDHHAPAEHLAARAAVHIAEEHHIGAAPGANGFLVDTYPDEWVAARLAEPLQRILQLRYMGQLSQRAMARELGMSPMQVCRLERRALEQLRQEFAVA